MEFPPDENTFFDDAERRRGRQQERLSPGLNAFRLFMSVLFRAGVILIMHLLGWLVLTPVVPAWGIGGAAVTALIIAVVFALLFELIVRAYVLSVPASCGLTMLLAPVVMVLMGFITVRATLDFAAKLVVAPDDGWFMVLVIGTLIWLATVPRYMLRRRRTVRRSHHYDEDDYTSYDDDGFDD